MIQAIYTLPEVSFIGGESQSFIFNLRTLTDADFDASNCSVGFALIHYANKNMRHIQETSLHLSVCQKNQKTTFPSSWR